MHQNEAAPLSTTKVWAGRVITVLVVLFLAFDSIVKVLRLPPAIEGTVQIGFPEHLVRSLGLVELVCLVLYVIPRTSILGAILLTGYLGGATAAQVRLESPFLLFSAFFGVLVWAGIYPSDNRLRALIPVKKGSSSGTRD